MEGRNQSYTHSEGVHLRYHKAHGTFASINISYAVLELTADKGVRQDQQNLRLRNEHLSHRIIGIEITLSLTTGHPNKLPANSYHWTGVANLSVTRSPLGWIYVVYKSTGRRKD